MTKNTFENQRYLVSYLCLNTAILKFYYFIIYIIILSNNNVYILIVMSYWLEELDTFVIIQEY